ncbi:MAG: hypothetical protein MRY57_00580 [Candidatus Pacebacteria bacterium]|nr:hypothetical protein [Candidatus Paceibacterota bacterium]
MLHNETIAFAWSTPEYEFKQKRKDWYWIVGAVAVGLIILAIILQNYLFAFLIAIAAFLMITLAAKEPLSLPIEISEHGIQVYKETYTYDSLFNFWITYDKNNEPILLLLTDRRISPIISLTIDEDIDVMELREYLLNFIDEQEMKESLTDRIIDKIGF